MTLAYYGAQSQVCESLGRLGVLQPSPEQTEGNDGSVDELVLDHEAGHVVVESDGFVEVLVILAFGDIARLFLIGDAHHEKQEEQKRSCFHEFNCYSLI